MFNNFIFHRINSFLIIFGMVFASMFMALSPAMAEDEESEPNSSTAESDKNIVYPDIKTFKISSENTDTVTFEFSLSEALDLNGHTLYLFKKGDSEIVDQISTGSKGNFTVERPDEGFEEYYLSVGDKNSTTLVVFAIENNDWGLTATVDKTVYSTSDTILPKISWNIEKYDPYKSIFLVDTTTGQIISRTSSLRTVNSFYISLFYDDFKTYRLYIASHSNRGKNLSDLVNVSAMSNEIKIEIDPWSITGSVDLEEYTTDNPKLLFHWESNQAIGGNRNIFLINEDTQEIEKTPFVKKITPETGTFEISSKYDNKVRNYKIYIADRDTKATNKSELTNIVAESNLITTDHQDWEVQLNSNSYSFYTDDETPVITATANQNMRTSNGYFASIYFIDVETGMSFYVGIADNLNSNISSQRIPRFYTEKEKKFKVIIAPSNCAGGCKVHEDDIKDIYAESNVITIKRAPWEIYTPKYVGYENYASIPWQTNQYVIDWAASDSPHLKGTKGNYTIYLRNLLNDELSRLSVSSTSLSGRTIIQYKDDKEKEKIHKYKIYLARTNYDTTTFDQLEDIQAESDVITVKPTKWDVALTDINYQDSTDGTRKYSINFTINKDIRTSQYSFYIANSKTGKIHHGPDNKTSKGISNFVVNQNEIGTYQAYIAEKIPGATNVSQFNDIQAVSNGLFPVETLNDVYTNYHKNKRFAAGGNPSTNDCQQTCYGDPINSFNGELFESTVDLEIDGSFPFSLSRTYSTLNKDVKSDFGYGWNFNYNMSLQGEQNSLINSQYITVYQENGSIVAFAKEFDESGNIEYISAGTVKAELTYDKNLHNFVFERKNGTKFYFNETGELLTIKDRNENQLILTRNSDGKITKISNGVRNINLTWENGIITHANDGIHTVDYLYDENNNLIEVKHSKITNPKKYIYYNDHKIQKIIHPNGGVYETFYDSAGKAIKQKDPRGNETTFEYSQLKTIITLPDGSKIEEVYNNRGWLISKTLAYSTDTPSRYSYEYSSAGDLIKETTPLYFKKENRYDSDGNVIFSKDNSGIFRFFYNEQNLLIKIINPMGNSYVNEYDDKGNLIKNVDYEGNETLYENDSQGRLKSIQEPNNIGTAKRTIYQYNNAGLLNKTVDTLGRTSEIVYNNSLNISQAIDPMGNSTAFEYYNNNSDLLKNVKYSNGSSENNIYDDAGRIVKNTGTNGNSVEYSYDSMDNILSIKSVYGTTSYTYDSHNRVISETNPKGDVVKYEYNALGLLTKTIYSNGSTFSNIYDKAGLLVSSTDGNGNITKYKYNTAGMLWIVNDSLNRQFSQNYDSLNRITSISSPQGNYSFKYDKNGNVISETVLGKTTLHKYDRNGNLTASTHPNSKISLYEYNSENLLVKSIDRSSKQKVYSYDDNDRITKIDQPGKTQKYEYDSVDNLLSINFNNGEKKIDYSYDLAGKILSSQSSDGVIDNYSYDAIGNLTSRGPPNKKVSYDYNTYGEIISVKYPSGNTIGYKYNQLDQLTDVKFNDETLASYTYDSNFNNISTVYGNEVSETNSFDTLNRLSGINVKNSNEEALYQRYISYNNAGYILNTQSFFNDSKTVDKSYTYNTTTGTILSTKNNLTNATTRYTHDVFDNLTTSGTTNKYNYESNYNLNSANVSGANYTYTYDELGNRKTKISSALHEEYNWNIDGTLKNVETIKNGNLSNVGYSYDNSGLISSKTVNSDLIDEYVWDTVLSSIPTLLEDSSTEYIYGLNNTPFAQIDKSTNEIHYLFGDERNSVVLATDDAGNAVLTREYDDYGEILKEQLKSDLSIVSEASESENTEQDPVEAKDFNTNFAYAGEYKDSDTGLYNLRNRWYEPSTGSFISLDPAFGLTDDAYGYASGNPLNFTDPLGLWSTTVDNSSNLATGITGIVDGALGVPAAGSLMNSIKPGSVDNCSILYVGIGAASAIGVNFIPGGTIAKTGKILNKGIFKYGGRESRRIDLNGENKVKQLMSNYSFGGGTFSELDKISKGTRKSRGLEINHIISKKALELRGMSIQDTKAVGLMMAKPDHRALSTTGIGNSKLARDELNLTVSEVLRRDIHEILTQTVGGQNGAYDQGIREAIKTANRIWKTDLTNKEFGL